MAVIESRYAPVLVLADTADDLKTVAADIAAIKQATVLATGKQYVLAPGGTTWKENGGNGTIPAYDPTPAPSTAGVVGTAIVGTSTVGSGE